MASCNSRGSGERGFSLIEALAASVIIFIVLAAALVAYFLAVYQSVREIVDSDVKSISRSVEHSLRACARVNLAPDKRSFYADVEGVRIFVPLPQPGQLAVDLPDFNEDMDYNGVLNVPPDIDWDQNGVLNAPAFAKPELALDLNPVDGRLDDNDNIDQDHDGVRDDKPSSPWGSPESFAPVGGLPIPGVRSQAYDGLDSDGDPVADDLARWMYPVGLLTTIESGNYKEVNGGALVPPAWVPPAGFATLGYASDGFGNWIFQPTMGEIQIVLDPADEDLNHDGAVSTFYPAVNSPPVEAALIRNRVSGIPFPASAFFPDSFEDRNRDGRITVAADPGPVVFDINNDGSNDYIEYSEDFNLNGFLDVPVAATFAGAPYFHSYYGPAAPPNFPADPLSQGLIQQAPAIVLPDGSGFGNSPTPEPYQSADFLYANQLQSSRNFGYTIHVQRVEEREGGSAGFGGASRSVYRFTLNFYFDYAESVRIFRQGGIPEAVPVQTFEVIVE